MAGLGDNYLDAIRGFEGFNPKPYWDYRQWTSGYGTRASGPGDTVDRAEADRRLNTELGNAASRVDSLGVPMSPGQRAALSSLTFNAGPSWMNSGLGAAVRSGDWDTARQRFLQYVNAGGQPLEGLRNRRMTEAQWFDEQPQQPQPAAQPAPPAQTEQPGGQRMAGLLDWLIPQAEAGTPGSFAPANRREQFGPPRWLYSPPMESIAPPSVNPRTGAPIPSMLPPGRSRALGGGGAAPAAAAAAPLGVPGPMMPGGGIGSDFAASPPPPPQVPPFDEGTTSLDPETTMRLAQAEHGRQNPPAPTPRRPGFGEAMESWMSSPLFQAAVALATQRDPAAAMASAGTARRQQSEYERQQSQRTVMDRIWGEAFPNGQPNMQHPLVRGLDPRVAQMIASMGPEQALPMLAQSAMKPGSFDIQDGFLVNKQTGQVVALQGGGKPPSGFQWAPGGQQLEPIPGGPGEHIAADQAGKLAVMRTAQNHFQSARSYFLGSQFGPGAAVGHAVGGAVLSPQYDQAARTVKLAVEGALRAVSGAAAPEAEVKRLTDFFTPRAFDPSEVRRQKMDMLQEFMRNHEEAVTRGRRAAGSNPAQPQSPAANDPLGIR